MNSVDVSIVVPVYNAETYLKECIESVLQQSFSNYEIILVNDGSTDSSGKICDTLAQRDNRIKVFHEENRGVSAARNLALSAVSGNYVIFLDADDYWLSADCLKILVNEAESYNADIVRGEYTAVDANGNKLFERLINKKKQQCANRNIDAATFIDNVIQGEFFLFLALFRYEKIKKLRFNENQVFGEDRDYFARFFLQTVSSCVYIPLRFYAYRKIQSSASSKRSVKKLRDSFDMCDRYDSYASQVTDKRLKHYFEHRSVMMYYWTLESLSTEVYYTDRHQLIVNLSLKDLQRRTCHRLRKYKITNSSCIFIVLPVEIGVTALRLKDKAIWYAYCIKNKLKRIL